MTYRVIFTREARADLAQIFDYLAARAGDDFARSYVRKIMEHCARFDLFPQRGTMRDDVKPGLRLVGYRRKLTIAFRIDGDRVVISRILHRGRRLEGGNPNFKGP